jgi:hypothetical protein
MGPVSFTLLHGQNDRDGSRKGEKLHYSSSAKAAQISFEKSFFANDKMRM